MGGFRAVLLIVALVFAPPSAHAFSPKKALKSLKELPAKISATVKATRATWKAKREFRAYLKVEHDAKASFEANQKSTFKLGKIKTYNRVVGAALLSVPFKEITWPLIAATGVIKRWKRSLGVEKRLTAWNRTKTIASATAKPSEETLSRWRSAGIIDAAR